MLSEKEFSILKKELLDLKEKSTVQEEETYPKESQKETLGELSSYDNHPADMGTALFEREKDLALHEHAESELGKVDIALEAMAEGSYGKCQVCNKDIPFERLITVPYTTFCVEHAAIKEQSVEEDAAINEVENPFESTRDTRSIDYQNSFHAVAEFGTSDAPSDFIDSEKQTYMDDNDNDRENDEISRIDNIIGKSVTNNTNNS
ncbi:TraR/DksA C4-type zinc finger protein [Sporosarcina sp. Marseille-Q4063]|uniref:TraR/DksA C4-type zinc finger protein n=1 Tax=Sporosarcina sp. Marseille-Q4063 TaxID=2810514 RepID=UPI001BAF2FD7|nr:TraR/DksA C4-type zinc finger protein [Sporosarcina sp. Marseille-Q4063]QUW23221.1 TraR/DksA C4-type zinc finger protein [Sporosarcina sp. Marseille-Q4063]